jgi:hypothetical protein
LRVGKSSKLVSALAILGLIVVSVLMVLVVDASSFVNPLAPTGIVNPSLKQGPTGTLVVDLFTNQNETNRISLPMNTLIPLGEWPVTVTEVNSSEHFSMITNTQGGSLQQLSAGSYVVSFPDESLNVAIPVQVAVGNVTRLEVKVYGTAYPLAYSEESGVLLTAGTAQSAMYVEVQSSTPVANASEPVILKVHGVIQGTGDLIPATVISYEPPSQGTQWLELGTSAPLNPVNASEIYLTTWTYSAFTTMTPIGLGGVTADA